MSRCGPLTSSLSSSNMERVPKGWVRGWFRGANRERLRRHPSPLLPLPSEGRGRARLGDGYVACGGLRRMFLDEVLRAI